MSAPKNIHFNTSAGPQIATGDKLTGTVYATVSVQSETDADGLTPGQLSFKHNVPKGTDPGTWSA